ncbi:MAG: serine/threonine-protein kinase, partial [Planctomycetota bacterium]
MKATAVEQPSRARVPKFSLPSGSRPLDGFTIKRGIGAGGFGEVYFATTDGGKDVAIKRIQRNLDIELRGVRQCLNLKHPNLVALFDIKYDDSEQAWVVMEYVGGESLQQVIERNPNGMPLETVNAWFDGITAGVAYLHDCGIVHRDLKPGNIFLDQTAVKIGDYGLSKFISCSRRSGQTQSVGTFHYMAPEIGQGRYGKEIDIYALGIMLYEMLTGSVPYDGESSQEIIMKHLTAQPELDKVPSTYRHAIETALSKDPSQRYSHVGEMRDALQLDHLPASNPASFDPTPAAVLAAATATAEATAEAATESAKTITLPNEPVARAVHAAWRELAAGWQNSNLGVVPRVALLIGGLFLLLFNAAWIIPYLGILAICYGVYLAIRSTVLTKHDLPTPAALDKERPMTAQAVAQASPAAGDATSRQPKMSRRRRREARRHIGRLLPADMRARLAKKSKRAQLTELISSLLTAALVCAVVAFPMTILALQPLRRGDFYSFAPNYAWLLFGSTLASWGVLIVSKPWEALMGDTTLRRSARPKKRAYCRRAARRNWVRSYKSRLGVAVATRGS